MNEVEPVIQIVPGRWAVLCFRRKCRPLVIPLLVVTVGATGCARQTLYDWGEYEDTLYLRYTENDFAQAESYLRRTLPTTAHPSRVPPGVYADYGFLLYRRGDYPGALQYFEKEKQTYPESSALMTKLIDRIRQKTARKDSPEIAEKSATGGTAP